MASATSCLLCLQCKCSAPLPVPTALPPVSMGAPPPGGSQSWSCLPILCVLVHPRAQATEGPVLMMQSGHSREKGKGRGPGQGNLRAPGHCWDLSCAFEVLQDVTVLSQQSLYCPASIRTGQPAGTVCWLTYCGGRDRCRCWLCPGHAAQCRCWGSGVGPDKLLGDAAAADPETMRGGTALLRSF